MLRFISTLTVLFFIHIVSSAQHYEFAWQNCFGGTGEDEARGIAQTADGYIVVGDTRSIDGDVTINYGGLDGWVVRLDQDGQMIWQRSYGGTNGDYLMDVFSADDGNFLLAGMTASQNGTIDHNPYPGAFSYWFMKVDGEGNIIWQTIAGGPNTNWLWGAYPTADGGIIGVGEIYGVGGDISVFYGFIDAWVVKLDASGQVEWDFTVGSPPMPNFSSGITYGNSVIQTSDGGYLIAANGGVGPNGSIDCIPKPQSGAVGILVKLDANGQHEWSGCYGGVNGNESLLDVVEVEDGYVFTGIAASTDGDLAGCGLHNPAKTDLWVAKVDFEGNLLWMHCYGGSDYDQGNSIKALPGGGLVLIGAASSHNGDVSHNYASPPFSSIWFLRLSEEGQLLYEACYGAAVRTSSLGRNSFTVINDNRLVVRGTTRSKPHHPPEHQGNVDCGNTHTGSLTNFDWWVFEIYDTTVFVQEHYHAELLKVFPNPATTQAWLQLHENIPLTAMQIELYSPTGRLLYRAQPTSQFHKIEVANLPRGLYLVRVWDGERWLVEKLVVG
jgi:hypothetical protein